MKKGKLKVLVRALKEIVDELESEIYSDVDAYSNSTTYATDTVEYSEMDDDDGYTD